MNKLCTTMWGIIFVALLTACGPVEETPTIQAGAGQPAPISGTAIGSIQNLPINSPMECISPLADVVGGRMPYRFAHEGVLPLGLNQSEETGQVCGTPTEISSATVVIFAVMDADGKTAAQKSAVTFTTYGPNLFTITGIITDWNLGGLGGITVTSNPGGVTTVTGQDGSYNLPGLMNGVYTITPASAFPDVTFIKGSWTVTVNGANENGVNFMTPLPPAPIPVPDPVPAPAPDPVPVPAPTPDPTPVPVPDPSPVPTPPPTPDPIPAPSPSPTPPVVVGTATATVQGATNQIRTCDAWGIVSLTVSPAVITVEAGNRQTFHVEGMDGSGKCYPSGVVWTTGSNSVAVINSVSGTSVAKKPGFTGIKATIGAITGLARLNVIEPPIPEAPNPPLPAEEVQSILSGRATDKIIVSPAELTRDIGVEVAVPAEFSAVAREGLTELVRVRWTSSDPVVAEIDPDTGVLVNMHAGMVKITATGTTASGEIITGSSVLTVIDSAYVAPQPIVPSLTQTLTSVVVTPDSIVCAPKEWYKFNAIALDELGQPYSVYIVWTSSDVNILEIDPVSGDGKCKASGEATVKATTSFTVPQPLAEPIAP